VASSNQASNGLREMKIGERLMTMRADSTLMHHDVSDVVIRRWYPVKYAHRAA
jgi:hypothetical protein